MRSGQREAEQELVPAEPVRLNPARHRIFQHGGENGGFTAGDHQLPHQVGGHDVAGGNAELAQGEDILVINHKDDRPVHELGSEAEHQQDHPAAEGRPPTTFGRVTYALTEEDSQRVVAGAGLGIAAVESGENALAVGRHPYARARGKALGLANMAIGSHVDHVLAIGIDAHPVRDQSRRRCRPGVMAEGR